MVRFAHLADCHLGSWRKPELQQLNLDSFREAISVCIRERVDFVLISGDLFDSAYPPIEILKETFSEFRKLKDSKIPCYIIAGSHDYSVSGKTFLDVLEKAGFCKNVFLTKEKSENSDTEKEQADKIILEPFLHGNIAIYGYPGKKSGFEIEDIKKIMLQDQALSSFRILMLHTTITEAKKDLPVDSLKIDELPKADYYALGHLHNTFNEKQRCVIYPGPIFPNNFQELSELEHGSFYIVTLNQNNKIETCEKIELKLKDIIYIGLEIDNSLNATEKIISELKKQNIYDKIIMLKLTGALKQGKISDINFQEIESFAKSKGAFVFLKNTAALAIEELSIDIEVSDMDKLEKEIINKYIAENPSKFSNFIEGLVNALNIEKQEDEKSATYEQRIFDEAEKILAI